METVRWFDDIGPADVDQVGGKGANLGELTRAGLPVPRGFVVTSGAFLEAIALSGARDRLRALVEDVDPDDAKALASTAEAAQLLVRSKPVPREIGEAVVRAYLELGDRCRVAVRSSATAEDAGDTSFAGVNATFTSVDEQLGSAHEGLDDSDLLPVAVRERPEPSVQVHVEPLGKVAHLLPVDPTA